MIVLLLGCHPKPDPNRPAPTTADTADTAEPTVPLSPAWAIAPDLAYPETLWPGPANVAKRTSDDYLSIQSVNLLADLQVVHSVASPYLSGNFWKVEGRIDGDDLIESDASIGNDAVVTRRTDGLWSSFLLPGWHDPSGCCTPGDIADLTGDGVDDVVFAADHDGREATYLLAGPIVSGHDGAAFASVDCDATWSTTPTAGDWTGDGAPDVAIVSLDAIHFQPGPVAPGTTDGCTSPQIELVTNYLDSIGWWQPATTAQGDFDGDGYADLAAALTNDAADNGYMDVVFTAWAGPFVVDRSPDETLFRYTAPGGLILDQEGNILYQTEVVWFEVGDLDDDGQDDVVLEWNPSPTRDGTGSLAVSFGPLLGELDYDAQTWLHNSAFSSWLHTLDDLDGDGDDDLVVGVLDTQPLGPLTAVFLGPLEF